LLLYETVVAWLIDLYGWQASFERLKGEFHEQGALIVLIGALTPIPFKLIAIASGVEQLNLWLFLGVALAGRAARFLFFGLLVWWLGPSIRHFLDRHAGWAGWLVLLLLVGGFLVVGLL
jgi:membrane protein YqaA with SNARE-associated domain